MKSLMKLKIYTETFFTYQVLFLISLRVSRTHPFAYCFYRPLEHFCYKSKTLLSSGSLLLNLCCVNQS